MGVQGSGGEAGVRAAGSKHTQFPTRLYDRSLPPANMLGTELLTLLTPDTSSTKNVVKFQGLAGA